MSDDILSQEEINALLKGTTFDESEEGDSSEYVDPEDTDLDKEDPEEIDLDSLKIQDQDQADLEFSTSLDEMEIDALGEIGNISMGTAATTLSTILGKKVTITTPKVDLINTSMLKKECKVPLIAIKVNYKTGLEGKNILLLKEEDTKTITDLMMGELDINPSREIDDMDLSAVGEAMNQMMGSSATSLSELLDRRIDIEPPLARRIRVDSDKEGITLFNENQEIIRVSFSMTIENYIDSSIMQLIPIDFAKEIIKTAMNWDSGAYDIKEDQAADLEKTEEVLASKEAEDVEDTQVEQSQEIYYNTREEEIRQGEKMKYPDKGKIKEDPVDISKPSFQSFDKRDQVSNDLKINLVGDIPIELTVELGRTNKKIGEILGFGVGTVIELDKLVGEPLNILANGKLLARGEVVVIDDSFGIRITEIDSENRNII